MKKIFNKIIKWWKFRKFDVRQACIDKVKKEYGEKEAEEFADMYDNLASGRPIGGVLETVAFISFISDVKKENGLI